MMKCHDWRSCGTYLERDTMFFSHIQSKVALFDCGDQFTSQLLFTEGNSFQFLLWQGDIILFQQEGIFEVNENTGEIRFYFDDGSSHDFLMTYLNNKKMVLIDKRY